MCQKLKSQDFNLGRLFMLSASSGAPFLNVTLETESKPFEFQRISSFYPDTVLAALSHHDLGSHDCPSYPPLPAAFAPEYSYLQWIVIELTIGFGCV